MPEAAQHAEPSRDDGANEMTARNWAVISFECCEAAGLTYPEAAAKLRELELNHITGLCVVTAEAAARIRS